MTLKPEQHHYQSFYKMMDQDLLTDHHLMLMRHLAFSPSPVGQQVGALSAVLHLVNIEYFACTGLPKGVMLSQSNLTSTVCLTNNIASGCARAPFDPSSGISTLS